MNLTTFYKIYYKHRFKKASFIFKIYLSFSVLVKYLINLFYMQKTVNVDNLGLKLNGLPELQYVFGTFLIDKNMQFYFFIDNFIKLK